MCIPVWNIMGKDNKISYERQSCTITMLASKFLYTNTLLTNFTPHTKGNIFTKSYHKSIALILIFFFFFLWACILCIMLGTNENRCEKNHKKNCHCVGHSDGSVLPQDKEHRELNSDSPCSSLMLPGKSTGNDSLLWSSFWRKVVWNSFNIIENWLGTFQSRVWLYPPFCYDDIAVKIHSVYKSAKHSWK